MAGKEMSSAYVPPATGIDEHTIEERHTGEESPPTDQNVGSSKEPGVTSPIKMGKLLQNRSRQLIKSFQPVRIFLQLLGRFPFDLKLKVDGTVAFKYKKWGSCSTMLFLVTSGISILIFGVFTVGIIGAYLEIPPLSNETDICNQTWEAHELQKTMVPIFMTWTWLGLLAVGSFYEIVFGKVLEFYYNYWARAVQVMDMDVTYGVFWNGIRGNIEFCLIAVSFSTLYGLNTLDAIQDTAAMTINCIIRWFYLDLYKGGKAPLLEQEYKSYLQSGFREGQIPDVFKQTPGFQAAKAVGFLIMNKNVIYYFLDWNYTKGQLYAMYGSRSFIIQFGFFCRVLRNAAWIWNQRFQNNLRKEKGDPKDQTKIRTVSNLLLKDHLILVQLFRMTEENFSVVLQVFYFIQVVNLTMILYAISLLTTITSCHEYWEMVREFRCEETRQWEESWKGRVSFRNPRDSNQSLRIQNTVVVIVLFIQVLFFLVKTTVDAATTYEEAMRGWQIFRRHSFMSAETTMERNFMHSLNISFARNNPLQISAGGYFTVNKELVLTILLTVLIYFTVMVQFRPGEINMHPICNKSILNIYDEDAYLLFAK